MVYVSKKDLGNTAVKVIGYCCEQIFAQVSVIERQAENLPSAKGSVLMESQRISNAVTEIISRTEDMTQ